MTVSRSMRVAADLVLFHSFDCSAASHCIYAYHVVFIRTSVRGHVFLAVAARAAVNVDGRVSFHVRASSGCLPRRGTAVSDGGSISSFLRNLRIVLRSGHTSLHSRQQCSGIPFPPHPLQYLLLVDAGMVAIMAGVR